MPSLHAGPDNVTRAVLSPVFDWRAAISSPGNGLRPVTKHVLLALSLYMSSRGDGACPSTRKLAAETGWSRKTVERHLTLASEQGWIRRVAIPAGRGRRFFYRYTTLVPRGNLCPDVVGISVPPPGAARRIHGVYEVTRDAGYPDDGTDEDIPSPLCTSEGNASPVPKEAGGGGFLRATQDQRTGCEANSDRVFMLAREELSPGVAPPGGRHGAPHTAGPPPRPESAPVSVPGAGPALTPTPSPESADQGLLLHRVVAERFTEALAGAENGRGPPLRHPVGFRRWVAQQLSADPEYLRSEARRLGLLAPPSAAPWGSPLLDDPPPSPLAPAVAAWGHVAPEQRRAAAAGFIPAIQRQAEEGTAIALGLLAERFGMPKGVRP